MVLWDLVFFFNFLCFLTILLFLWCFICSSHLKATNYTYLLPTDFLPLRYFQTFFSQHSKMNTIKNEIAFFTIQYIMRDFSLFTLSSLPSPPQFPVYLEITWGWTFLILYNFCFKNIFAFSFATFSIIREFIKWLW